MPLAVIGGTGLTQLADLVIDHREMVHTPYGQASGPVVRGHLAGVPLMFMARHGHGHTIPPHRINYRANLWALQKAGATQVAAIAAVGGIDANLNPGDLVIPEQIIDYTSGREATFFEGDPVRHIDFTQPYDALLRGQLIQAARPLTTPVHTDGCYGATQGPRLESAAEIQRMARDGCTIVGMTGMPEAVLARELDLPYATCALVVNRAAGLNEGKPITMADIEQTLATGMIAVRQLLQALVRGLSAQ
ncbi:S-methyl-5'-thioinosine phosphorylase [Spiribacter sp. C176]|uniref:Probable S-methyl-5'-thioinosine phosphorylase n=1 Tax=Spiribacter salilacus TaxID=2664894 RepID=A0A6N7QMK0_9GAMM|nr:S-methyl-5'-thioinosine phosphorylase [Spiribacter salilacus]MRH77272.1 S-methyl-5'-thioinosine phosphorylase [Spiribacter salilacus]